MEFVDMRLIYYFIEVAKCLNYTVAADALYISQSSLSRQIIDLEKRLGVKLFIRNNKTVKLTPAGEELLLSGEELLMHMNAVLDRTRIAGKSMSGNLRIGSTSHSNSEIIYIIKQFQQKYKTVSISMDSMLVGSVVDALFNNSIDLGYTSRFEVERVPFIDFHPFSEEEFCVLVAENSPLAECQDVDYKDLISMPFVFYDDTGRDYLMKIFEENQLKIQIATTLKRPINYASLILQVELLSGVTFIPESIAKGLHSGVKMLRIKHNPPKYVMGVAWRKDCENETVKDFVNFMKDY